MYLVVFLAALGVDLIPIAAPPAWTILAFLLVKYRLNPWGVLAAGVHPHERLDKTVWRTWMFVLVHTLTPLSTTALFTAAGMTQIDPVHSCRRSWSVNSSAMPR